METILARLDVAEKEKKESEAKKRIESSRIIIGPPKGPEPSPVVAPSQPLLSSPLNVQRDLSKQRPIPPLSPPISVHPSTPTHVPITTPRSPHEPLLNKTLISPPRSIRDNPDWSGKISYHNQNFVFQFSVIGWHVNGPQVEPYIPLSMRIDNRTNLSELLHYLPKLDQSTSRNRSCIYFEAAPSEEVEYRNFFVHLKDSNRGGVIAIEDNADKNFLKELYIYPLSSRDPIPPFLKGYELILNRKGLDTLIGVFLTSKVAPKLPTPPPITPTYKPNPILNTTPTIPSSNTDQNNNNSNNITNLLSSLQTMVSRMSQKV
jgi:hypothetical protein